MKQGTGTRIIAGERRGFTLLTPPGLATRPTLGRVRESLFMILQPRLHAAHVLDAYAGSGALGLEALSRGAAKAVFVEQEKEALAILHKNIARLGWRERCDVIQGDARDALRKPTPPGGIPFDVILLDPPYGRELGAAALAMLAAHARAWLAPHGVIVVQAGKDDPLPERAHPFARQREKLYGLTRIVFYEWEAPV